MNKKYKLIKEYPGSLKKGIIVWKKNNSDGITYENESGKTTTISSTNYDFFKKHVTDYPEFWEEYEIKAGDNIKFLKSFDSSQKGDIVKITRSTKERCATHGGIWVDYTRTSGRQGGFRVGGNGYFEGEDFEITDEEISKQPLFTTEDGVDIFEGDKIHYCNKDYKLYDSKAGSKFHGGKNKHFKYFSTKEAAEEYILMNKPCLSISDVMFCTSNTYNQMLIKLLKQLNKI